MNGSDFKIRLDLNENPYDILDILKDEIGDKLQQKRFNRYPDSTSATLKASIAKYTGIDLSCIAAGNGSNELIMIIFQAFLNEGDKLMLHKPSFSMYKHYAGLVRAEVLEYETDDDFGINIEKFKILANREQPKMILICNPNNPTGKLLEVSQIEDIIKDFEGILVIDEAYYEFGGKSSLELLNKYKNIILLRTFSKALGLAGLRIGYMMGNSEMISAIDRIRSPFNVNAYSQSVAAAVLENIEKVNAYITKIIEERERLFQRLCSLQGVKVFKSQANFILIRTKNIQEIYEKLLKNGIKTRVFEDERLKDCIRITVGTPYENDELLKALEVM